MVHLVVGLGEVGSAIHKIVGGVYVTRKDSTWDGKPVAVVHICIPYSTSFERIVESYKAFAPLIIVHSTVPVGTCDALDVVHSPIRGVHPQLEKGIRTFVKYFGGRQALQASRIFSALGMKVRVFDKAKTTEAIKLWDTTYYGKVIMIEKEIYEWCKENKISYKAVYTIANEDYNEGYTKLGMSHVVRPVLKHKEGPIGGHCVLPNAKLLGIKL